MNPRERLRRAVEDGERIYRAYMHGDIEDMTAADLNRLSGILTLDLPDALGTLDGLLEQLEAAQSELTEWRTSIATEKRDWRIEELEIENGRLRAGMERIIEMGDYVYKPHEFAEIARVALSREEK